MINYYLLMKPGIILGNLITLVAGYLLASKGKIHPWLFLATLIGLSLIIGSACAFNNYIDRKADKKMQRTKNRPLAKGAITEENAILFATFLGIVGAYILFLFTNLLTLLVAMAGFSIYVFFYSLWKRHTVYGTAIGSIAGATPPVVGYCAVSGRLDVGALIFFVMMVLWQMPHSYAIAIWRLDDYEKAEIPVLPVMKGVLKTKIHMVLYVLAFLPVSLMLTPFGFTGYFYLAATFALGIWWLKLSLKGFDAQNDRLWAKEMFRLSLVLITAICFIIPFDVV